MAVTEGKTQPSHPRAGRAVDDTRPLTARRSSRLQRATSGVAGSFLLPNLILIAIFLIVPLIYAFVISFQQLGPLGSGQWIGVGNYLTLAVDPVFWQSMWNTGVFTLFTVPTGMALGLAIAVLFNSVLPARTLFRSIVFLPLVVSGVATGVLGAWMFDQNNGFINKLLTAMHLAAPDWQSTGFWAMLSIILMTLWQRVGFDMLIYLAGLQGVDPALLEAATVDGATGWKRFRSIVLPLLGPLTFFLLVMNLIYSFQVFDTVWSMTRGGPGFSTTTVVTYAYRTSFDEHGPQELGYGAAVGVAIYLITLLITALQWRFSRTRDETA